MGTPEYQAAAEWIAETANALGLPEVRIEKYLSDGISCATRRSRIDGNGARVRGGSLA